MALATASVGASSWDPFFAPPAVVADFGATTRPFGLAAGDFDGDGKVDLVVGRVTGHVAFVKGNGDGTFAAPIAFDWKQTTFNAWAFAAADVNGDGTLDVVWGANAASSGCSVSPVPSTGCPLTLAVNDGDVRVFYGNGDGTFQETTYFVSGVRHNAGTLLADIGSDAGSVAAGDIDGDGDVDVLAGAVDGTNSVVKLLRNDGVAFVAEVLISQPTGTSGNAATPTYFPGISTQNSPWGLALGDADGDADLDVWIGDRALYAYLYVNNGVDGFTLLTGQSPLADRPRVYLAHDSLRAAVGFTPSLAAGDVNGDGRADLFLGLQSGVQTPVSGTAHDGEIVLDVSNGTGHQLAGVLADVGTMARGVSLADVNGDGHLDVIAAEYDGKIKVLRQLPPVDTDTDGVSDYVDNAVEVANAPRIDLNTDGTLNYADQLDNDADTVLGDPENQASWLRLGDPADPDDDNDGAIDSADNCPFTPNGDQADADADGVGNACDPLDDRDADADNVPDGPAPGQPLFDLSLAAKAKWASGTTRFVIRIDALGRFFQNEFTQIMTDAATLSPAEWAAKCWENYELGDIAGYEPCGDDATKTLTLPGGKEVPVSLVVIPKQLWTDAPVVSWINDRNNSSLFELGQHGTYHFNNVPLGDWQNQADRNFFSCETCGLTEAENFELLKAGADTLLGNYDNKSVRESGATDTAPKIDWAASYWPLISYAPPFNASDTLSRKAVAQLGFKAFSASVFEESGFYSNIFSPEGSHHEQFNQFGTFHASADVELEPPDTTGDTYDVDAYEQYLHSQTNAGGLTTWLIEEVEWSGRPCQNDDRLGTCNGGSNRENNTVYLPRWNGWLQLLDFVKNYPEGVAMTMAEVALAQGFDNAPTVANAGQADADADGIGDVIDGAALTPVAASLSRNVEGQLAATLVNGSGAPIVGQGVTFLFDADGDDEDEAYEGTTDAEGMASVNVTATRAVGPASFTVEWDGRLITADAEGTAGVFDAAVVTLDATNPTAGQVTDTVIVGATLTDSDGVPLAGRQLTFQIAAASVSAVTDASGHAAASIVLAEPAGNATVEVRFAGDALYGATTSLAPLTVQPEDTDLVLANAVSTKNSAAIARARLTEADGAPLQGRNVRFEVQERVRGQLEWVNLGTAATDATGTASLTVPARYATKTPTPIRALFDGDASFRPSQAAASAFRN